jgi:hypothetical protein
MLIPIVLIALVVIGAIDHRDAVEVELAERASAGPIGWVKTLPSVSGGRQRSPRSPSPREVGETLAREHPPVGERLRAFDIIFDGPCRAKTRTLALSSTPATLGVRGVPGC